MTQNEKMIYTRLNIVLKKEDMDRIKISNEDIVVDLHSLGTKDAMILVNNIINLTRQECNIKVIHGYNHGTDMKDMINSRFKNPRIKERKGVKQNLGVTILSCTAM